MKILTVCREVSLNLELHNHAIGEFIFEQNKAVEKSGIIYDYFLVKKSGLNGYIQELNRFIYYLKEKDYKFDIIHAHGGHIGSIVNTQRKVPVITTYHGSDINYPLNRMISMNALLFSKANIFVSMEIFKKVQKFARGIVIPCGVDMDNFKPIDKLECRKILGLNKNEKIVLFAGRRERKVKNYELAEKSINLSKVDKFIELKDYARNEVNLLLNAADLILLTSFSEGSPQVIKEAMACNCPIVATDVGDIKQIISDTEGCYLASFDPNDVADKIKLALQFNKRTNGREKIKELDNNIIAKKIVDVYEKVIGEG